MSVIAPIIFALLVIGAISRFLLTSKSKRKLSEQDVKRIHKRSFHPKKMPEHVDVIVIGSGSGGMSCASILAQQGYKVLVLEQHDRLGGCTHTFELTKPNEDDVPGHTTCEFDTGCHYMSLDTGIPFARSGAIMEYVTGGRQKWRDLGPVWDQVLFPEDARVEDGCPNEVIYNFRKGLENIAIDVAINVNPKKKEVLQRIHQFFDFCKEADMSIISVYINAMLPKYLRFLVGGGVAKFQNFGRLTTAYVMNAIFDCGYSREEIIAHKPLPKGMKEELTDASVDASPSALRETWRRIKGILVHPIGDYACQPRDSSIVAHSLTAIYYAGGAAYTIGPTQNISMSAAAEVIEHGGDALVNVKVEEILLDDGGYR